MARGRGVLPRSRTREEEQWLDPLVLPSLAVLAIVVGYPIVYTLVLSVQDYNMIVGAEPRFVAAAN